MQKFHRFRKTRLAWITLGVGLLASVFAALQVRQGIQQDAVRQFAFNCDQTTLKIQERLGAYALMLRGGAALFAALTTVERNEWRAYVETLRASGRVPGVQGIGFAEVIPPEQLAAHLARIRSEGFPDYSVRPSGPRALYTSIIYLEPFRDRNLRAFGFDMYAEPVRRAAMDQARDTGEAALSGKVELVQETGTEIQAGTLMYVPVYRNGAPVDTLEQRRAALLGWAYSPYRMNDLMTGILGDWRSREGKAVDLTIYDGREAAPAGLLFDSQPDSAPAGPSPLHQQRVLDFNGQPWLLMFARTASAPGIGDAPVWATLAGGLALTGLLFWLMLAVINTRTNAERIAGKLTEAIRRHETLLRESEAFTLAILDAIPAEIVVVRHDGMILAINEPWRRFALDNGNEPGQPALHTEVGINYLEVCRTGTGCSAQDDGASAGAGIRAVLDGRLPSFTLEYPCHSPAQQRWFTMTVTPLGRDTSAGVVITHTDITKRKQAELAFRRSETMFRAFFDSTNAAVMLLGEGGFLDCNKATMALFGCATPEEFCSYHPADVSPPQQPCGTDSMTLSNRHIAMAMKHGGCRFEWMHKRLDNGQTFIAETLLSAIQLEGKTTLLASLHDITERKRLEDEREAGFRLLQKISDRVPGVVFQYRLHPDGSSCMPFASEALREMFRVSPQDVRHDASSLFALVHPDDLDRVQASIQQSARDLTKWDQEFRLIFDDGSSRWLLGNALPDRQADGATLWHGFIADITERRRIEAEIAETRALLLTVIDTVPIRVFWKNRNLCYLGCNTAFARDAGMAHVQDVIGKDDDQLGWSDQAALYQADDQSVMASGIPKLSYEEQQTTPSGQTMWLRTSKVALRNQDHVVFGLLGIYEDITEWKQAEQKVQLAASVFTHAYEGIMITAADGTIIDVNDAFSRITSYRREDVLGRNPRLLSSGRQDQAFYANMWDSLIARGQWSGEIWNRRNDGEMYAVMQTISAVPDAAGNTLQYVSLFSDITLIKEQEQTLQHIAHYDALTGLPNRVLLADRLHQGMVQAQRYERLLAVALLDLDGFKAINDEHGHAVGDQLLIAVAASMQQVLREGDTLARIGGDEFVAVLLDLADIQASVPLITRLLAAAAQSVPIGEQVLQVSASVGVTFYPQADVIDAGQLLRQADQAMYQAKLAGKNRYHVFDAELDRSVRRYHESLERIRGALDAGELVLHYQPKVNMRTGAVLGAEALIRWQHPQRGLLPPAEFLPMIEDHPLAVEVGEWVIETALSQMERWQAAGLKIPVSVNVGALQLQQADFVARLRTLLAAHPHVRPGDLEIEVLETSALADLARVSRVIDGCREIGVPCALDDFGTGYASLTYLKRLPVELIKIDQSFVRDMLDDPDDLAILDGVIGLCAAFHRQVIAEGVEALEQGQMLLQLGCELAQGYGIARPMPAADIPSWLATWRPDPAWVACAAVSRDAVPLLFAGAAYRAWMAAVEGYLTGARDAPPPLDDPQSCFGIWLDADGPGRHGARPAFQSIEALHQRVHALAVALCELRAQGRNLEAVGGLGELRELRDAVLEQLKTLVQVTPGVA